MRATTIYLFGLFSWNQNLKESGEAETFLQKNIPNNTPRSLYELLLKKLDTLPSVHTNAMLGATLAKNNVFDPEEHKQVTIWKVEHWANHPKNKKNDDAGIHQQRERLTKDQDGVRDSMFYIQNTKGESINERKAGDICAHARTVWEHLAKEGIAPKSWKKCSAPARAYYLQEMYIFHADLQLCEGDWKAERLATDTYAGWYRGRKNILVKQEVGTEVKPKKRKEAPAAQTPIKTEKRQRSQPTSGHNEFSSTSLSLDPLGKEKPPFHALQPFMYYQSFQTLTSSQLPRQHLE